MGELDIFLLTVQCEIYVPNLHKYAVKLDTMCYVRYVSRRKQLICMVQRFSTIDHFLLCEPHDLLENAIRKLYVSHGRRR